MDGESKEGRIVATHHEIAEHFGVSTEAVHRWARAVPAMPGERGHYDLDEVAAWKRARPSDAPDSSNGDVSDAKERKLVAEADKLEAQARMATRLDQVQEGQFVLLSDVIRLISQKLLTVRERILCVPEAFKVSCPDELKESLAEDVRVRLEMALTGLADTQAELGELERVE